MMIFGLWVSCDMALRSEQVRYPECLWRVCCVSESVYLLGLTFCLTNAEWLYLVPNGTGKLIWCVCYFSGEDGSIQWLFIFLFKLCRSLWSSSLSNLSGWGMNDRPIFSEAALMYRWVEEGREVQDVWGGVPAQIFTWNWFCFIHRKFSCLHQLLKISFAVVGVQWILSFSVIKVSCGTWKSIR